MYKEFEQWLDNQGRQQSEFAEIGAGLVDITLQGVSDFCDLYFGATRRQLTHGSAALAAATSPEELPLVLKEAAEKAAEEMQSYLQETFALVLRLHKQREALIEDHLKLFQASADSLIDHTRKLSPGAPEVVGSALRSWVEGAHSAVAQMNQMSSQFSEFAGDSRAVMAAWQSAKAPARNRRNGKAVA